MTTIKDLIQETEKGCGKPTSKIKQRYEYVDILYICGENPHPKDKYCEECKEKINLIKQCQTIADEREKEIIKIIEKVEKEIFDRCSMSEEEIVAQYTDELKQQLNPAQKKDGI
jgi:hypothetical protein